MYFAFDQRAVTTDGLSRIMSLALSELLLYVRFNYALISSIMSVQSLYFVPASTRENCRLLCTSRRLTLPPTQSAFTVVTICLRACAAHVPLHAVSGMYCLMEIYF